MIEKPIPLKQWQCPFCDLQLHNQRGYDKHLWKTHALQSIGLELGADKVVPLKNKQAGGPLEWVAQHHEVQQIKDGAK